MTASLPSELQDVFERFVTTEYVTIDRAGHPIAWPVTPYYRRGGTTIDVTTGLGYPKKANDARENPRVALLFSDPNGCGLDSPPMVLVQGVATVDDANLHVNRERYLREFGARFPDAARRLPPARLHRWLRWYLDRIYVKVRPERVFAWSAGDIECEPELHGTHLEEARSGHSEEPETAHADPEGGGIAWDLRMGELGTEYPTAVLALVAPDGFPFAARVPVRADPARGRVRVLQAPSEVPWQPGLACLTAHAFSADMRWQRNFQVRGDLVLDEEGWAVIPHRLVGGFELPTGSPLAQVRRNLAKVRRYRRTAKRELARRAQRR